MQFFTSLTIAIFGLTASAIPVTRVSERRGLDLTNTTTMNIRPFPFEYNENNIDSLTATLKWIDSIPDSIVLAGPESVKDWAKDHDYRHWSGSYLFARNEDNVIERGPDDLFQRQNWLQIANCVVEITKAIAEGYFPVAKLLRVKDIIKKAGGVRKAAEELLKADNLEDLKKLGEELWELAMVLAGVDDIADACFSIF